MNYNFLLRMHTCNTFVGQPYALSITKTLVQLIRSKTPNTMKNKEFYMHIYTDNMRHPASISFCVSSTYVHKDFSIDDEYPSTSS